MKTLLMVLSYKYPYEPPTEQFLHAELPYHKSDDTDILIVPYANGIDFSKEYEYNDAFSVVPMKRSKSADALWGGLGIVANCGSLIKETVKIIRKVAAKRIPHALIYTLKQQAQISTFYKGLKKTFKDTDFNKYDKVILYSYWLNSMAPALISYKKHLEKTGAKKVVALSRVHGQGDLYIDSFSDEYRPFSKTLSKLDCIYCLSEHGVEHLRVRGIENTAVARLGIDRLFDVNERKCEVPTIVSCSVINENKRVTQIAKAVSKLSENVHWIHFGGGDDFDALHCWCCENMPENVSWELRGWSKNEDIQKMYSETPPDVFINLSRVEGVPVSIMEAMSYSVPCIATNAGATSAIVENGKNGYLLPVDFKTEEVCEALSSLLTLSDEEKAKMRQNALETWNSKFNAATNFTEFSKEINKL